MGSFKLRLVIYFMLLALLPLVAATVAFSEVARRGETGSADARLSTAITVAQGVFEDQIDEAGDVTTTWRHAGVGINDVVAAAGLDVGGPVLTAFSAGSGQATQPLTFSATATDVWATVTSSG